MRKDLAILLIYIIVFSMFGLVVYGVGKSVYNSFIIRGEAIMFCEGNGLKFTNLDYDYGTYGECIEPKDDSTFITRRIKLIDGEWFFVEGI